MKRHFAGGGVITNETNPELSQAANVQTITPQAEMASLNAQRAAWQQNSAPSTAQSIVAPAAQAEQPKLTQPQIAQQSIMSDMNNLGKVAAQPGQGAGASYNWNTKSATEQGIAAGINPNAAYKPGAINDPLSSMAAVKKPQMMADTTPTPQKKPAPLIAQIDPMAKGLGFANGGKIKGPGTPTSDSIQAQVKQTGEPIKVSTGERIVSAAQDEYLGTLAKKMGFDSVDAMLEAGTGQPVGPTIKSGQKAAANGVDIDRPWYAGTDSRDERTGLEMERERRAQSEQDGALSDPVKSALVYGVVGSPQSNATSSPSGVADIRAKHQAILDASPSVAQPVASQSAQVQGIAAGVDAKPATYRQDINATTWNTKNDVAAKMIDAKDTPAQGTGIASIRQKDGSFKNVSIGPQSYTAADGSATDDWMKTKQYAQGMEQAQRERDALTKMQRENFVRNTKEDIKDPRAILAGIQGIARMDSEASTQRAAEGAALDTQAKRDALAKSGQINQMIADLSTAKTPEELSAKRANILAAQGRNPNEHRFFVGDDETTDTTGTKTKRAVLLDAMAPGGRPGQQAGSQADAQAKAAQIKSDAKSGKITREEAIKQLQSIGFK